MRSESRAAPSAFNKVLLMLENIKSTDAGKVIFDHVASMLGEIAVRDSSVEQSYAQMLNTLLDAVCEQIQDDAALRLQIKMVQLRLEPPISYVEINETQKYIDLISSGLSTKGINVDNLKKSLNRSAGTYPGQPADTSAVIRTDTVGTDTTHTDATHSDTTPPENLTFREETEKRIIDNKSRSNSLYQQHLDQKNLEIGEIRDSLARHVNEAIAQNEQFGVLLGVELEALRETETIEDIETRRMALVDEIEQLIGKHAKLSEKFSNASKYLTMIESDNQQLSDELERVRLLSLTDELTTLPNRRAFMRRLEDEVGRVKRYGYPISLTLLDLDRFKEINDSYGHAGGDAVLKSYAEEVLTIFRHHDMVARYGGEEFVVILPNTEKEGALSALRKVQEGVSQMLCTLNDKTIAMPTFSAGLAQYIDGETPAQFIARADKALYRAKQSGRNRIELASDERIKNQGLDDDFSALHA